MRFRSHFRKLLYHNLHLKLNLTKFYNIMGLLKITFKNLPRNFSSSMMSMEKILEELKKYLFDKLKYQVCSRN